MASIDPRERLLALATGRGASLAQLSAMIGRNATYLQQFVRKGSPRKLEEGDRGKLARYFGVAESELGGPEENSRLPASRAEWVDVPRLALGASAGPGALAEDEAPVGSLRFTGRFLRDIGLDPAAISIIRVAGDSMEPTLRDGDEILVDRAPRAPVDAVHVVWVDGVRLVKRLDLGQPGIVGLVSDNPAYKRVDVPSADVHVIGRVVWKAGRI